MGSRVLPRRRLFQGSLGLAGLAVLSGCGRVPWLAQPKVPRIGYLSAGSGADETDGFRRGLAEIGYVEGRTVAVEWRDPEGRLDRLPDLATELVRLPVDVLVAGGLAATRAARGATGAIPIVMANTNSPVESGLVASLAHPGGNVTGLASTSTRELVGKRLELLKESVPVVSRVGVLWNPAIAGREGEFQVAEAAAGPLGLELRSLEARDPGGLDGAFERALLERLDGLFTLDNIVLTSNPGRVGAFARAHRLPMMSSTRSYAVAGGLIAYGVSRLGQGRRTAAYVDKILNGAKPADLPVEQPSEFELVVNLTTAQALGLTIPEAVLQRATQVIQ